MTLETLQVIIQAQTKEYMEAMNKVQQQTANTTKKVESYAGKIKSAFGKIGKVLGIALSVAAIINFGKQCIELGSDLAEVQNVVDVTFQGINEEINEFARNAIEQFGLSELSAKQYASTMGAMLKSMGFATRQAADMSMELTGLAGDIASFYNLSGDEAFAKIRSGISGETEPLKQLGINLSVANLEQFALTQGMQKSYSAMTQQEQALLRYNYLLSVTSDAQGDFARTSDSWANQTKILTERFNSLKAAIGQGLINVFTPVLRVINQVVAKLVEAANAFKRFTEIITGKKSETNTSVSSVAADATTATSGMDGLTEATNEAGGAAKKAEEAFHGLLGFDEINSLTKAADSSGSGSDTSGAGGLEDMSGFVDDTAEETDQELNPVLQKLIDRLKQLRDLFKAGFKAGLGDVTLEPLKKAIEGIKNSLKEIFTDPGVVQAANHYLDTLAYSLGQITGAVASIGITIATNLFGGLNKYLEGNKDLIKQHLINMFDISSEIWTILGNFAQAAANIFSVFGGENGQRVTAALIGIFANTLMGVEELCAKYARDILDVITRPFIDNQEGFKTAIDGLLGIIAQELESIKDFVDATVEKLNSVYDESIHPFFDAIATGISDTVGIFLDFWNTSVQPVLEQLAEQFDALMSQHITPLMEKIAELTGSVAEALTALWDGVIKPLIDWIVVNVLPVLLPIFQSIVETIYAVVGNIADIIGSLIEVISGIIDFVVGIFTGDWKKAWEGIQQIIDGVMNAIAGIIELVMNIIGGVIRTALDTISAIFSTVFNAIASFTATIFNTIKTVVTTVIATIKAGISSGLNTIKTIWTTIWTSLQTTVTTIFNGIWKSIKGVINSIIGGVEGMANAVVNGINTVINALNNLSFDIPDWVPELGGEKFGFDIPTLSTVSLPRLAMGGIVDGATPLIAGEAGKEAIVPLERNTGWMDQIANRLGEMIVGSLNGFYEMIEGSGSEDWQTITTIVQIDGRTIVEQTDKARRRKGYKMSLA